MSCSFEMDTRNLDGFLCLVCKEQEGLWRLSLLEGFELLICISASHLNADGVTLVSIYH